MDRRRAACQTVAVAPDGRRTHQHTASPTAARPVRGGGAAHPLLDVQRVAGNRSAQALLGRGVQRLELYGTAAATASALPAATATAFQSAIASGDQAGAVRVVVDAMTARGELDARLMRTSGEGELWEVRDIGDLGASVSFRSAFADPDDPSRRLPNPRFAISPRLLRPDRPDALQRLHIALLHEFRHVRQAAERVNLPAGTRRAEREPGYANDPDEFDAYLSEVEFSYDRMHMLDAALQAGVSWEFLAPADRTPFQARWTAARARIESVLGYGLDGVLSTSRAEQYRARMREAAERARSAREGHAH
jgi:hypothetical protein